MSPNHVEQVASVLGMEILLLPYLSLLVVELAEYFHASMRPHLESSRHPGGQNMDRFQRVGTAQSLEN